MLVTCSLHEVTELIVAAWRPQMVLIGVKSVTTRISNEMVDKLFN